MCDLVNLFGIWDDDIHNGHRGYEGCSASCVISAICPVYGMMRYTMVIEGMRVVVHHV